MSDFEFLQNYAKENSFPHPSFAFKAAVSGFRCVGVCGPHIFESFAQQTKKHAKKVVASALAHHIQSLQKESKSSTQILFNKSPCLPVDVTLPEDISEPSRSNSVILAEFCDSCVLPKPEYSFVISKDGYVKVSCKFMGKVGLYS